MVPNIGRLLGLTLPILHKNTLGQHNISATMKYYRSYHLDASNETLRKKPNWNSAILQAENVVGYRNGVINLQTSLNDETVSDVGEFASHSLQSITKKMINSSRNILKTTELLVQLAAKTAGRSHVNHLPVAEEDNDSSILRSQKTLAQVTKMLLMAYLIHKTVVNLKSLTSDDSSIIRDVEDENKSAVLVGDYLFTSSMVQLALLKNTLVFETMNLATKTCVEGAFVFEEDVHGSAYPLQSQTIKDWEARSYLASLLSNSFQSAMILADHKESVQWRAFNLGKKFGLTWQAFMDLQSFTNKTLHASGTAHDLASLPFILHVQSDPNILDVILPGHENLETLDYEKIYSLVYSGPAISKAKQLCKKLADETLETLYQFPPSDARQALQNIIAAMNYS